MTDERKDIEDRRTGYVREGILSLLILLVPFLIISHTQRSHKEMVVFDFFKELEGLTLVSQRNDTMTPYRDTLNLQKVMKQIIYQPLGTTMSFVLTVPRQSVLRFYTGMDMTFWKQTAGVRLAVDVSSQSMSQEEVFAQLLNPEKNKEQWGWTVHQIDLSKYAGQKLRFNFSCSPLHSDELNKKTRVGWADLKLLSKTLSISSSDSSHPRTKGRHAVGSNPRNPVILFVMVRQTSQMTGVCGNPRLKTPWMDYLSRKATLYANTVTPSLHHVRIISSILTGMISVRHGIIDKDSQYANGVKTVAGYLREKQYTSYFITNRKLTFTPFAPAKDFDYSVYDYDRAIPQFHHLSELDQYLRAFLLQRHQKRGTKPFFLTIYQGINNRSLFSAKRTLDEKSSEDTREKSDFHAFVRYLSSSNDRNLGTLITLLKTNKQLEKSLLICTGGYLDMQQFNRLAKRKAYRVRGESIYSPTLIHFPRQKKGHLSTTLVSALDIAPTILNYLQLPIPEGIMGIPLRFRKKCRPNVCNAPIYLEYLPSKAVMFLNGEKVIYEKKNGDTSMSIYNAQIDYQEKHPLDASNSIRLMALLQRFRTSPLFEKEVALKEKARLHLNSPNFSNRR